MTGGVVQRVEQGSELDTATVSGGRIIGQFFAGDFLTMTGGQIGEVNLKQANNEMRMSGGVIDRFVIATQGRDLLILSVGSIGTFVDLGSGDNRIFVCGGSIGSTMTTAGGNDQFTWDTAGTIGGAINLGAGNDSGTLQNLTAGTLSSTPSINGGAETDSLTFSNTTATNPGRYVNWENVSLTNSSAFTLNSNFVLGDSGIGTGNLSIDGSCTLYAGNGANAAIAPFRAGQLVNVTNAGTIDLTNGSSGALDTLTVLGNYTGSGGAIRLQMVLGDDSSACDKFIISGGTATGTTGLAITNLGGAGASTVHDGILVVQAVNGATTSASAFSLSNPVAAGAFDYYLFKGGVTAGSHENWYLRSTPVAGSENPTLAAGSEGILPPGPGVEAPNPGATPVVADPGEGAASRTCLRQERTFRPHGAGYSGNRETRVGRVRSARVDGQLWGIQVGHDIIGNETENDHRNNAGLFFAYSNFDADIKGEAVGWNNLAVGSLDLDTTSFGGYWTHIGPSGWYLDGALMGCWFSGDATSLRDVGIDIDGTGITASLEGGYPVALSQSWRLEPQAQLIWQHLSLDDQSDAFSDVGFDTDDGVTGRLGLRLQGKYETSSGSVPALCQSQCLARFQRHRCCPLRSRCNYQPK